MLYQIWMEGYLVSGCEGVPIRAIFCGKVDAADFKSACKKLWEQPETLKKFGKLDPSGLAVWACRLFDNEADARKSFG